MQGDTEGRLVVGFDLDMTLIDTAPGFGAVLTVLGAELGVEFPVAEMTARLGSAAGGDAGRASRRRGDRARRRPVP